MPKSLLILYDRLLKVATALPGIFSGIAITLVSVQINSATQSVGIRTYLGRLLLISGHRFLIMTGRFHCRFCLFPTSHVPVGILVPFVRCQRQSFSSDCVLVSSE
jgi:hypothetical protein